MTRKAASSLVGYNVLMISVHRNVTVVAVVARDLSLHPFV